MKKKDKLYCPDRGDLIWLNFTPQAGREQAGRRPAIVLSPKEYNRKTQLAVVCPITSKSKGYPFEVLLPNDAKIDGVILSDHMRNVDWFMREAEWIDTLSASILIHVVERIQALIF